MHIFSVFIYLFGSFIFCSSSILFNEFLEIKENYTDTMKIDVINLNDVMIAMQLAVLCTIV